MTARNDVRRGRVDARGDAHADRGFAADGPTLPERLVEAREQKGVDIYRAERDTKIRVRYLQALEAGDYGELPGAVYTKGFLRNYALYLGLDPDEVVRQWRHEDGDTFVQHEAVLDVPRPLQAPRQGLTFSPVIVVAALLTVLIGVFAVYLGIQLVRFAKPPTLAVTSPVTAVVEVGEDATEFTLAGTSTPKATVTIQEAAREQPYRVSADATGRWTADVQLRRGRNEFTISAIDPETMKPSENTEKVFITVPFLVLEAPTLTVDSPADGAQFENGAIPVKGSTTNASTVAVSAVYTGPVEGQPASVAPGGRQGREGRAEDGQGRLGRLVRDAARPVHREVAADRHGDVARGQVHDPDPRHLDPLQGRHARRGDQERSRLDQGLGRRQGLEGHRHGRQGLQPGQGPDLHRQAGDRGPHGQVERDLLHAQRQGPRPDVEQGQPRDVAVRAVGQADPHRTQLR